MSDFLNRIDIQRRAIKIVNSNNSFRFHLAGLSINAVEKWREQNDISIEHDIMKMLLKISSKIFFLSNKSQEQITEDYKILSTEVDNYLCQLEGLSKNFNV
ncbi:hypothetical protein [Flavobacterium sp. PL02]|uniref:hypothetical protein n=1 Tax=Flavobacterium sp. PL02 TaxID=3088354 RepID=UPI002B239B19|nr:hypothetical protein [Flavobacterium sp. PL02]MEA9414298.1 hypothetical protein [Flavobacterium sp. PL02]